MLPQLLEPIVTAAGFTLAGLYLIHRLTLWADS